MRKSKNVMKYNERDIQFGLSEPFRFLWYRIAVTAVMMMPAMNNDIMVHETETYVSNEGSSAVCVVSLVTMKSVGVGVGIGVSTTGIEIDAFCEWDMLNNDKMSSKNKEAIRE